MSRYQEPCVASFKGVKTIVTLTTDEEMKAKNVKPLGTNAGELGVRWYHLAIEIDRILNLIG